MTKQLSESDARLLEYFQTVDEASRALAMEVLESVRRAHQKFCGPPKPDGAAEETAVRVPTQAG